MPKRLISLLVLLTFFPSVAMGLPVGGKVVGGTVKIGQTKNRSLHINQLTDRAIINWKGFNINVNELVKFIQPNSKSIILNRVIGVDPSSILGKLVANGRVFVVNPNGILFGPNSAVDVSGLLATTLNIKDADFMAGKFNFSQDPGKNPSYVINQGQIRVSDNGFVFLAAPGVSNEGLIIANLGKIVMGSGEKFTVDFLGDGLITFAIDGKILNHVTGPDGAPLSSAVANTGKIKADGGQVILSARASSEIFSSVVNNSGVIEARSLVNRGGIIRLEGSDPVPNTGAIGWQNNLGKVQNAEGAVTNTGKLDVSAAAPGAETGQVTLSGQMAGSSGTILARGAEGSQGGRVLITSTDKTVLTSDSQIDTSGAGNSSAGNVVVWSDKDTIFRGTILAKGGEAGGNGGQIEVSGHENLNFTGQVNALAPNGSVGSVLLDPANITIATGGGATLAEVDLFSDTPTSSLTIAPATINAAAANVVLQANNDITISNAATISMTNAGVGITMQAGRDINVNTNASVSTNNGFIAMTANDSAALGANRGSGTGDITMAAGTNLNAGSGNISLTIGPSAPSFNPGNISAGNLATTTGNITLNSPNALTLNNNTVVNAGSGTVTINANSDGAGNQGFTMNAGSSITTSDTSANAVQINVNAAGGGTGAAALRDITTGSGGTLTVATNTGAGGDITQAAGTLLNVGAGTINLTTPAITGANIGSSGANILTTAGTITASTGTSGVFITESDGANLTATATGGGANNLRSITGALNIAGATSTGSGAITLTAEAVNINDSLTSTGGLTLNPVTADGNLTVSSSSASNLSDGFSSITIGNASGTGAVTVNELTVSDPLTIRSPTTTGTVTVNGPITGLGNASVTLTGGTGTTPITLNAGITTAGNTITLNDNLGLGTNVTLDSTNGAGSPPGATISVTGTIDGAQALTLTSGTAGNVTLSGAIGNTQPLQSLSVTSANALTVPTVTTTGDIQLNAQNAVTLNGAVNAGAGAVTINANSDGAGAQGFTMAAGSSITTTDTVANAVQINVNAAGGGTGAVALRDITTGSGGTLTVATNTGAGGDITQAAGTLLNVGAGTINLTTASISGANIGSSGANILTTAGTINASTGTSGIFVTNQTGVDLAGIQTTGPFSLTTNGPITGSGIVNVGGTATLSAGAANITLNNAGNDFNTAAITSGNDVSLADANALNLAASTISGNLNLTTAGAITDSGNLSVSGTTTLAAGAGNDVTLNSTGNNFSTLAISSGRNVTLVDSNALDLGTSSVSGNFALTTGGAVTQSGALSVAGTTSFTASAANTDVLLNTQTNHFGGVISFAGTQSNFRDIALHNTNAGATVPTLSGLTSLRNLTLEYDNASVNLPALTASGTLNVTAGGAITQSGNLNVAGTTTLAVGTSNVTLSNAGNNFSSVSITSGNNVTLRDANALDLGTSTVSGALNVSTNGAITQSGLITVTGATTFAASVGDITLDNAANDFSTVGITSANNVTLQDSNNISLGTSTVAGNFSVSAGGSILDGDGSGINVTANTANLIAASNIGTAVDPLETDVGMLNLSTTTGGIFINEANAVTLGNVSAGGGNDIAISNTSGNMTVNAVSTESGAVSLIAAGGAIQDGNGAANNVTAGTLLLSSANGIDLDTTINNLSSAIVTGAGFIDINNTGALTVNNMTAANGDIALNATGGSLVINAVTGAGDVTLSTTTSGDITLGTVTSPNSVTITSAGGISGTNGAATHISANTANLAAAASVGTSGDPIGTSVGMLNVAATDGGIYINETDTVTLGNIMAGGGHVSIHNTTGNMIINSITAAAGGINLQASAGSIFDGNGAANNLTAVADSNLRALGGVIGLSTDPIEVNISSGMLGVAATGQAGGVSIDINGAVLPSGTLTLLNSPPGEVIFNSQVLHPASISPPNLTAPDLTGIAAELNPQRVNEDDYVTELLLDVLGDDLVETQPLYCKSDDSLRTSLHSHPCTETNR